jgi:hypothetical protein
VLRIHDILVWIRIWIRGSTTLNRNDDPAIPSLTFQMPTKN